MSVESWIRTPPSSLNNWYYVCVTYVLNLANRKRSAGGKVGPDNRSRNDNASNASTDVSLSVRWQPFSRHQLIKRSLCWAFIPRVQTHAPLHGQPFCKHHVIKSTRPFLAANQIVSLSQGHTSFRNHFNKLMLPLCPPTNVKRQLSAGYLHLTWLS